MSDFKGELHRKLLASREGLLSKLDGLSEYDIRRPMTRSGTNLLGLVKHLAGLEYGYLGESLRRPPPETLPWVEDGSRRMLTCDVHQPPPTGSKTERELLLLVREDPGHDAAPVIEVLGSSQDRCARRWISPSWDPSDRGIVAHRCRRESLKEFGPHGASSMQ